MMRTFIGGLLACVMVSTSTGQVPATCEARSGARLVPLVELYTSEGCDSCPPADRWLSSTFPSAQVDPAASVLAFHVDYWDRLGWKDRFAQPVFTDRQHAAMRANGATFVYTPQVLLQGRDLPASRRARAANEVGTIGKGTPGAEIVIVAPAQGAPVRVRADVRDARLRGTSELWLAYTESDLTSNVKAGENKGVLLHHDHVVRALYGPYRVDGNGVAEASIDVAAPLERGRAPAFVAFVQDPRSGSVLQTLTLACAVAPAPR